MVSVPTYLSKYFLEIMPFLFHAIGLIIPIESIPAEKV
jgi:hypothetical protein